MNLIIKRKGTVEKELDFTGDVKTLLEELKINPEEVLVAKNNELVEEDEEVTNKDTVTIFSVVSGG